MVRAAFRVPLPGLWQRDLDGIELELRHVMGEAGVCQRLECGEERRRPLCGDFAGARAGSSVLWERAEEMERENEDFVYQKQVL